MKIILILVSIFFSFSINAQQLSDAYNAGKEKITSFIEDKKICPVYSDTPISKVERAPWEIEIGVNMISNPSNGDAQFRFDSWSGEVVHNFSSVLGAFVRYDALKYEKREYENTKYGTDWSGYSAVAGFHLYLMPTFRLYGGVGKIQLKDENGNEPDYENVVDFGLKYDIPLDSWGYKVVVVYKIVNANLADEKIEAADAIADGSQNIIGLMLSLPFGYPE